jgi:hypothetical protein
VLASLVLLTPLGGIAVLGAVFVVAAFVVAGRRVGAVRRALRLDAPGTGERAVLAALLAVVALAALVAVQPAWEGRSERSVRTDAQVDVVLDTSRSMLAARGPEASTRLERAKRAAIAIRAGLPDVPVGVGTLTDRVLPNLLPSPSEATFDATVQEAIDIEQPPPAAVGITATTLAALAQLPRSGTFAPSARTRAVVVLTDGESRPFDPGAVAAAYRRDPSTTLVLVHVWNARESIYGGDGSVETAYRPDPSSGAKLAALADAAGGRVFGEGDTARVVDAIREALGSGPTKTAGLERRTQPLGRYVALAALVPLVLVLRRRNFR